MAQSAGSVEVKIYAQIRRATVPQLYVAAGQLLQIANTQGPSLNKNTFCLSEVWRSFPCYTSSEETHQRLGMLGDVEKTR